jgi:hypothetical protein
MYTTCEAGKRRTVNHMRAHARSPRRAVAVAVAVAEARPAGQCGARARPAECDVTCRCGAVRRDVLR